MPHQTQNNAGAAAEQLVDCALVPSIVCAGNAGVMWTRELREKKGSIRIETEKFAKIPVSKDSERILILTFVFCDFHHKCSDLR